ncbi:hypothetical protein [Deinococcus navajonensis]|uniref:Uncharacterized protein n=1 Tax=Deinococcus navajonensis TaxID=309884 RepID=A0ABV8XPL6_9DEIO
MPLTGTKTASTPKPKRGVAYDAIIDQLDSEWASLKQDNPELHGDDAGLLAYFHSCTRSLLHDIRDPYTQTWPAEYEEASRVPKLCAYLRSLQDQEGTPVKIAREQMLQGLRTSWPAYRDLNPVEIPNGTSILDQECPPFSWEALVSNWPGETAQPHTQSLPHFSSKEVADFNLAAFALLFLNRQLRYYLTDLKPHPTDDGRS